MKKTKDELLAVYKMTDPKLIALSIDEANTTNGLVYSARGSMEVTYGNKSKPDPYETFEDIVGKRFKYDFSFSGSGNDSYYFKETPDVIKSLKTSESESNQDALDNYCNELKKNNRVADAISIMMDLTGANVKGDYDVKVRDISTKPGSSTFKRIGLGKVVDLVFDKNKSTINKILIGHKNGDKVEYTQVDLNSPVSSKDVDRVMPGYSLPYLGLKFKKLLGEDYESTLRLMSNIFGVNFETLERSR